MWQHWLPILITAIVGYCLGNINGAICVSALLKDDVRAHGSGNAGLTNFVRNYGWPYAALVVFLDVGKTLLACFIGRIVLGSYGFGMEGAMIGAIAVSLGHDFPAFLGFRGGKGILCGFTIALILDWRIGLLILGVFALAFALTQYVSLGSLLASVTFAVGFVIFHSDNLFVMIGGILIAILALWMHRSNVKRLLSGTESKIHLFHRDRNKKS